MLDIKHIDPEEHLKLTSQKNDNILSFARYVDEKAVPLWIRHVVVPGITDQVSHLKRLGEFIAELRHVKALDVLPYHTIDRKSTRLNSSHSAKSRMPSSA